MNEQETTAEILRLRVRYHELANSIQNQVLAIALVKAEVKELRQDLLERQRYFRWIVGTAIAAGPTVAVFVAHLLHGS